MTTVLYYWVLFIGGCDQKSKLVKSTLDFDSLLLALLLVLPTPAELQNSLPSKALNLTASLEDLLGGCFGRSCFDD